MGVAALAACSSNNDEPQKSGVDVDQNTPITIKVTDNGQFIDGSRASFNSGNLDQITVMTTNHNQRYFTALCTRNGSNWQLHDGFSNNSRTYYWPWSGMDVYALAGNMSVDNNKLINNANCAFGVNNDKTWPNSFTYTVENGNDGTPGPVNDPMYAATVNCNIKDADKAVNLNFRHLLSRITFGVLNLNDDDNIDIYIRRIAFDKIYTSGTYTPAYLANTTAALPVNHPSYGRWTNLGTITNCSTYQDLGAHFTKRNDNEANPFTIYKPGSASEPYELLLMPQSMPDEALLCVEYSITNKRNNTMLRDMAYQRIVLPANQRVWQQNTQYRYILKIAEQIVDVEIIPYEYNVCDYFPGGEINPSM